MALRLRRQRGVRAVNAANSPARRCTAFEAHGADDTWKLHAKGHARARGPGPQAGSLPPMIEQQVTSAARHWVAPRVRVGIAQKPWLEMTERASTGRKHRPPSLLRSSAGAHRYIRRSRSGPLTPRRRDGRLLTPRPPSCVAMSTRSGTLPVPVTGTSAVAIAAPHMRPHLSRPAHILGWLVIWLRHGVDGLNGRALRRRKARGSLRERLRSLRRR